MISKKMAATLSDPANGVIRKMFEEGAKLKAKFGEDKVFDFSLGNPSMEVPKAVQSAILKMADDSKSSLPRPHGYMSNAGFDFARAAMAKKTASEQGVAVTPAQVVLTSGAAAALNIAMKALLDPGDEVITPTPYFGEYKHYIENHGGLLRTVKTTSDFSLDLSAIKSALNKHTKAIILNSPNNPTGQVYSEESIKALCEALKAHNKAFEKQVYIIADEPYRAITFDGETVAPIFPYYEYSIIATSFAKNFSLPGERLGYVAVNKSAESESLMSALILANRILGFVNAPAFFQRVVSVSWDAAVDYTCYKTARDELLAIMDKAGLEYAKPKGAFYLFVKVPKSFSEDDGAFCDHLKKFNILCAPGSGFGKKGWFRVSFCTALKTIQNSKGAWLDACKV